MPSARRRGCVGEPWVPPRLQSGEILLLLPLRDLDAVLVPLAALELDVAREDVLAERAPHEIRLGELVDRLAERLGQRHDALLSPLGRGEPVEVALHRVGELVALFDSL